MKLVGGDSGRVEHEEFVDDVVLAPSERVVVDVLFDQAGELTLEHRTPERVYPLAAITVGEERAEPSLEEQFEVLRTNAEMVAERERIAPYLDAEPDKTLAFIAEMDMGAPEGEGPVVYACPMHPEVVSEDARPLPRVRDEAAAGLSSSATAACRATDVHGRRPLHRATSMGRPRARTTRTRPRATRPPTGSSGKTTWSTSTG